MESNTTYRDLSNPREGIDYVSEADFHRVYTEREGASFILQGYARMLGCETYSYSHTMFTPERMRAFVAAFGKEPQGGTVPELWQEVREVMGLEKPAKAAAKKDA